MRVWQDCRLSHCFPAFPKTSVLPCTPLKTCGLELADRQEDCIHAWASRFHFACAWPLKCWLGFPWTSPLLCVSVSWLGGTLSDDGPHSCFHRKTSPPLQTSSLRLKEIYSFLVTVKKNKIVLVFPVFPYSYFSQSSVL